MFGFDGKLNLENVTYVTFFQNHGRKCKTKVVSRFSFVFIITDWIEKKCLFFIVIEITTL